MTTDKELLMAAAKAAGIVQTPGVDDCYVIALDQLETFFERTMELAAQVAEQQAARWDGIRDNYVAKECAKAIRQASTRAAAALAQGGEG